MRPITRAPARLPAEHMQTYRVISPADVLVRTACEQVGCPQWRNGWDSVIDESTKLGADQARYIRTQSGRTFTETKTIAGWTVFRFESGQRCFADHRTRPESYLVVGGDHRGNPRHAPPRRHSRPADWVEDMADTLDGLRTRAEKG